MRILFSLVLISVLWSSSAMAKTLPSAEAVRELSDKVMMKVSTGDWIGGISLIKPYMSVSAQEVDRMADRSKSLMIALKDRLGENIGYEFIREYKAGDSLIRIIQIEKRKKSCITWVFTFYKSKDVWIISGFNFSDSLASTFN